MTARWRQAVWFAVLAMALVGCASTSGSLSEPGVRPHAYAFSQPELLATQRVFGVGHAVTLLGDACAANHAATASYTQWRSTNGDTLRQMTLQLAVYYRIQSLPVDRQQRVAEAMHLKTALSLSDDALVDACNSLPETLELPWMNLAQRYQATLAEVRDPNYLKPQKPKKTDDGKEQARTE